MESSGAKVEVRAQTSVALVVGRLADGSEVSQEIAIPHQPGVVDDILIGHAIGQLRQMGGMLVRRDDGSVDFYSLLMIPKGINVSIKRISLALGTLATQ